MGILVILKVTLFYYQSNFFGILQCFYTSCKFVVVNNVTYFKVILHKCPIGIVYTYAAWEIIQE